MRVAVCISEGLSNKEIVQKLHLSEGTIRNYISSIIKKTGLKHRTQIAIYTLEGGFTEKTKKQPVEAPILAPNAPVAMPPVRKKSQARHNGKRNGNNEGG